MIKKKIISPYHHQDIPEHTTERTTETHVSPSSLLPSPLTTTLLPGCPLTPLTPHLTPSPFPVAITVLSEHWRGWHEWQLRIELSPGSLRTPGLDDTPEWHTMSRNTCSN
ncbi:hypothetical protein E2C01_080572 [Portunus trituberculatus]|uniref:Uncharacterized protein n=1 Tax=Portunus trituberculatus TaxID=210409 RepID=A0A5B7IYQ5_PORTR|nr:hypothetical protein [Portunus trituberculatus]